MLGRVEFIKIVYCIIKNYFIISHPLLTSRLRSTVVLLDAGTPGPNREDTVKMSIGRLEPATLRLEIERFSL